MTALASAIRRLRAGIGIPGPSFREQFDLDLESQVSPIMPTGQGRVVLRNARRLCFSSPAPAERKCN